MRVNHGTHFCEGHGHYDVHCPACVMNQANEDERARIVAWLRGWAEEHTSVVKEIPAGAACRGGPFDGCPEYDLAMKDVRRVQWAADAIERGEHLK